MYSNHWKSYLYRLVQSFKIKTNRSSRWRWNYGVLGLFLHDGILHGEKTDLKPVRKWAVPCDTQPISVMSTEKGPDMSHETVFTLTAGSLRSSIWERSIRRLYKWGAGLRSDGPTWSCWKSRSGCCWSTACSKLSPTGACSSASACASPSWDPQSWTWGVRPGPRWSRSPGSSSASSFSCWWAAAWEDSSRKRE